MDIGVSYRVQWLKNVIHITKIIIIYILLIGSCNLINIFFSSKFMFQSLIIISVSLSIINCLSFTCMLTVICFNRLSLLKCYLLLISIVFLIIKRYTCNIIKSFEALIWSIMVYYPTSIHWYDKQHIGSHYLTNEYILNVCYMSKTV